MTEHAKGTPGLWHVDADGMSIVTEDGMVVAEVQFPHDGDREGIREAEADAFRLAAVPQMEAFIRRVAFEPIGHPMASHRVILDALTEEARGIIAATVEDDRWGLRIAAVPQMEAALEAVERYMGGPSDDPCFGRVEENENDDDTLRVLDIVRSALAAARGESEEVRS